MSSGPGVPTMSPDRKTVQQAIAFLTSLDPDDVARADLSPRLERDALIRIAADRGFRLSAEALEEGFRVLIRARLLALRISSAPKEEL